MRIGDAARRAGLPVKTLRYYADIGLVTPCRRQDSSYRDYSDSDVRKLGFIRRAREFGFSIPACRDLLGLYENKERSAAEVKAITLDRLRAIEEKLRELQLLRDELSRLAHSCQGDHRPDCPILDEFSGG